MTGKATTGADDLPATLAEQWDQLCDRFEEGWKDGRRPRIEDFLGLMPEPGRLALFRELLWLDLAYRHACGERPRDDEYKARFPRFAGPIGDAFDATIRRPEPPTRLGTGTSQAGLHLLSGTPSRWRELIGPRILAAMGRDLTPAGTVRPIGYDDARFRVLRPHARGGLGAVFVARDEELNREVALKQIQDRFAGDPVCRARFLAEAVITGNMEHPGVVPVYGLGWQAGQPYYAMRLVRGESLKEALDQFHKTGASGLDPGARSLALRKLLGRFVNVCDTVAYAHDRGVLHRDLKPSNIMLGPYGETLVVDWGLAIPIGAPEDDGAVVPQPAGLLAGTPAYMSPEQAAGARERIGVASDLYSLGATLYAVLAGKPPFVGSDVFETLHRVGRGDFPPPRQVEPRVAEALEAICLKAMATRPDDRYPTARALADDVERWLGDEPVSAWREPLAQRARRWARRHRTAMTGAAVALLFSLVGLSAVATVEARANRDLKRANSDKTRALAQSEDSRRRAEAVLRFLERDVLAAARPEGQDGGQGKDVTVQMAVNAAEPKIAAAFQDQPAIEADVRATLATTYLYLGDAPQAIRQLERALELRRITLGDDHPDTLTLRNNLAKAYREVGRTGEAVRMHEEILRRRAAALGPGHPDVLNSRNNLASAYLSAGRTAEAVPMLEENLRQREATLGADHPRTLSSRNNLAAAYAAAGRTADALWMLEETLKRTESKFGPDHPDTLTGRNNLAVACYQAGRIDKAIGLLEATLKSQESQLGLDHPDTLASRNNLAMLHDAAGHTAKAIALHEQTFQRMAAKLGADHPDTLASHNNLAAAYAAAGRTAEAIALHEAMLERMEAKLGADHPRTLALRNNLAAGYAAAGRTAEALALHEQTLERMALKLGADHPDTLTSRSNLAATYEDAGRTGEAARMHEVTLRLRESKLGPDHPDTLASREMVARLHEALGRWAVAEPLRRDVLGHRRQVEKPVSLLLARALAGLGANLLKQAKCSEAEPLLRECLALRGQAQPDGWSRFHAMSLLGGALLGQGRYAEAEPLIIAGYEGMKVRAAKVPRANQPLLNEAAVRLVRLYQAWGKTGKASEWKARVGLLDLPDDVFTRS